MGDLTDYERGNMDGQALNDYQRQQAERGERILREQLEKAEAENTTLRELLREAWNFPERPGPADGEMADEVVWNEQGAWDVAWEELNNRIVKATGDDRDG